MRRIFGKPAFVDDGTGHLKLVASPVPLYPECSEYRIDTNREIVRVDTVGGRMSCRLQLALFDRSALFLFLTTLLTSEQWKSLIRGLYYVGMPNPNLSPDKNRGSGDFPITHHILRRMADDVRETHARFALVATPTVLRHFADSGVVVDLTTALELDQIESADPALTQFKHDSHYAPAGHRIVAKVMTELILPMFQNVEPSP